MTQEIFQNGQVDISLLPTATDLTWKPLESGYRQMLLLLAALQFAVLVAVISLVLPFTDLPAWVPFIGLAAVALIAAVQVLSIVKGFPYKGYVLRTHDLLYRTGWLFKKQVAVPVGRIQHVDIRQGIYERAFGLYKINIYTAGGESSDITIPGLREQDAQRIKTFILNETALQDEEQ